MVSVGRRDTRQKLHGTGKRRTITTITVDPTMKRFDEEILDPFLRSTASQLAVRDGTASSIHPLTYLIKAKTLQQEARPVVERQPLPKEIATLLSLQSSNGKWRLCKRLYQALGHTMNSIPIAPSGVQDWRWATALAVTYLRRSPEFINDTYDAYSRALAWVNESVLVEAHGRLPPADLYYPVDDEAARQGRWREQVVKALEDCGYAYFLPAGVPTASEEKVAAPKVEEPPTNVVADYENATALPGVQGKVSRLRPQTQEARLRVVLPATPAGLSRSECKIIEKEAAAQLHGLRAELKRAVHMARKTFKEGDRIESRWRRPTRLDRPRVDPYAWHPGQVVGIHKDGKLDIVFETGDAERLSGIPAKHARLAPAVTPHCSVAATNFREDKGASPHADLRSANRRELAHIASATSSLRCTWENPVTMDKELARLRKLWEEKMQSRPAWQLSFPAVNFEATKRLSVSSVAKGGRQLRRKLRQRRHALDVARRTRTRSRALLGIPGASGKSLADTNTGDELKHAGVQAETRNKAGSSAALARAQSHLIASAIAYDRCMASVHDCFDRGASAFGVARTYSEQQTAFEEATAVLGPAQPARAGYSDWRGRPVVGLQNATLDVVEAMDAWAAEWTKARDEATGGDREEGRGGSEEEEIVVGAPPFVWGGVPLVSTIVGHSAKLLARTPELREWYGPGFPIERNPFCLAYAIDDRPDTPRNALVRAYVNGQTVTTVSPALLEERKKEEADLKVVVDKQAAAPSWWPAAKGAMSDEHYGRVRRGENILLREERQVDAASTRGTTALLLCSEKGPL